MKIPKRKHCTDCSKMVLFVEHFCYLCFVFVMFSCLAVNCLERADLLALLCVMFYCVFVTFPCGVLDQVCCLIVSILDLCHLSFFILWV